MSAAQAEDHVETKVRRVGQRKAEATASLSQAETKKTVADTSPIPLGLSIKHIVRTIAPLAGVDDSSWSGERANREIGKWLGMGYDLRVVRSLGLGPDGVHVLWVLTKRPEGREGASEAMHITRRMTAMGAPGTVTGFQADALLAGFIAEGWEVSFIETLGMDPTGGLAMFWVLTR